MSVLGITGRPQAFLVDFGSRKTELTTVHYQLLNADGSTRVARTATGVTHVKGGIYQVSLTVPSNWSGSIVWDTGEEQPEYAAEDIVDLGESQIKVVGPVNVTGPITILAGDDYKLADGRAITFQDPSGTRWPDLHAAVAIKLAVLDENGGYILEAVGQEVESDPPVRVITVDIEGDLTAQHRGKFRYRLLATLADGDEATLANGPFQIKSPFH